MLKALVLAHPVWAAIAGFYVLSITIVAACIWESFDHPPRDDW